MSKQKALIDYGQAAEQFAAAELILQGFSISWSVGDKIPHDFIAERSGKLFKIQVKGTFRASKERNLYSFSIKKSSGKYEKSDVDFYVLYVHPESCFYIIPFSELTTTMVRISPKHDRFKNAWHLIK